MSARVERSHLAIVIPPTAPSHDVPSRSGRDPPSTSKEPKYDRTGRARWQSWRRKTSLGALEFLLHLHQPHAAIKPCCRPEKDAARRNSPRAPLARRKACRRDRLSSRLSRKSTIRHAKPCRLDERFGKARSPRKLAYKSRCRLLRRRHRCEEQPRSDNDLAAPLTARSLHHRTNARLHGSALAGYRVSGLPDFRAGWQYKRGRLAIRQTR